ncbi:hypothetical protein [Weissella confusa]|nr:hypothetical protein [Weissella confusa]UYY91253.1 hypothetical protein OLB07_05035 [Weissella confusa]
MFGKKVNVKQLESLIDEALEVEKKSRSCIRIAKVSKTINNGN